MTDQGLGGESLSPRSKTSQGGGGSIPQESSPSPSTFYCEMCDETFNCPPGWNEDDALAEFEVNHPEAKMSNAAVVCEVCHRKIKAVK